MGVEPVRMWRPADHQQLLLMAGQTTEYTVQPTDEYVFGVVDRAPMISQRGHERRTVCPGQLVAWDPSQRHTGTAVDDRPWTARLMVVRAADLSLLAGDPDVDRLSSDVGFREPVVSEPGLVRGFRIMHAALAGPTTRLAHDELVAQWLRAVISRVGSPGRSKRARPRRRDDRALRIALDYLAQHPERNVGLDELATVAGVGRFHLIDAFRDGTGLAPHAFQIAHRIRTARRLLESGATITETAVATGFADQSHLHRHFRRSLGMTPGEYQRRFLS